jgi:hypothetical protein
MRSVTFISFFSLSLLFGLYLSGCIDQIEIEEAGIEELIVIEGNISTLPGPYQIRISRSSNVNDFDEPTQFIRGAQVEISGSDGTSEFLTEVSPGVYETREDGIRGKVAVGYTLRVLLEDGSMYQSTEEMIEPVPELDTIAYELTSVQVVTAENIILDNPALDITAGFSDPSNTRNYYLWKVRGIHEIIAKPFLDTMNDRTPPPCGASPSIPPPCANPAPIDCSCCRCYVYERFVPFTTTADDFFNGNFVSDFHVVTIPVDFYRFSIKYRIIVEQHSLSQDAQRFWEQVFTQDRSTGTIFDPPSVEISGNIRSLSDDSEKVLGAFYATDVSVRQITLNEKDLDLNMSTPDDFIGACFGFASTDTRITNVSNMLPENWCE